MRRTRPSSTPGCAPPAPPTTRPIIARFSKWAEDYFFIPHRGVQRGVGGIFYDHLEGFFEQNFAFTRDVGEAFLDIFPKLVRRRMATPFDEADRARQLAWRGRYAEFNLIYDRGTLFGLKTGGNVDAILMSLPPVATWAMSDGADPGPARPCRRGRDLSRDERAAGARAAARHRRSRMERWDEFDPDRYRALFRRVGARWLWFSRLAMSDAELLAKAGEVHEVLGPGRRFGGDARARFRRAGPLPDPLPRPGAGARRPGHGRWLFAETLARAWAPGVSGSSSTPARSTIRPRCPPICGPASPPTRRAFESFPDPRLAGLLPRDAAPQLPLVARPRRRSPRPRSSGSARGKSRRAQHRQEGERDGGRPAARRSRRSPVGAPAFSWKKAVG